MSRTYTKSSSEQYIRDEGRRNVAFHKWEAVNSPREGVVEAQRGSRMVEKLTGGKLAGRPYDNHGIRTYERRVRGQLTDDRTERWLEHEEGDNPLTHEEFMNTKYGKYNDVYRRGTRLKNEDEKYDVQIGKTQEGRKPYRRTVEEKALAALGEAEQKAGVKLKEPERDRSRSPVREYYGEPNGAPGEAVEYEGE